MKAKLLVCDIASLYKFKRVFKSWQRSLVLLLYQKHEKWFKKTRDLLH